MSPVDTTTFTSATMATTMTPDFPFAPRPSPRSLPLSVSNLGVTLPVTSLVHL